MCYPTLRPSRCPAAPPPLLLSPKIPRFMLRAGLCRGAVREHEPHRDWEVGPSVRRPAVRRPGHSETCVLKNKTSCAWVCARTVGGRVLTAWSARRAVCRVCVCQVVCSRVTSPGDDAALKVESAAGDCVWLRFSTGSEAATWLAVLQRWQGALYLNGGLDKRARLRRTWKKRYMMLAGPDLHWSASEGAAWLGRVRAPPATVVLPLVPQPACWRRAGDAHWRLCCEAVDGQHRRPLAVCAVGGGGGPHHPAAGATPAHRDPPPPPPAHRDLSAARRRML